MKNNKTFRLFISSTFDDFRRERDLLRTEVFPEVKQYYASKGFTFQPIDLRWGVTNEAQLDQKTMELCLDEVRACKSLPNPNFLLMLGDRYGWIPLPYAIEKNEFELLLPHIPENTKPLLLNWYREDLNQIPVSYILKERRNEAIKYEEWLPIESQLRMTLQNAVDLVLDVKTKRKYFLSVTEAEVEEGIFPYLELTKFQGALLQENPGLEKSDTQHIFSLLRSVDPNSAKSTRFIGDDYAHAQSFKQRVSVALPKNNILEVQTKQVNEYNLNEAYLQEFSNRVIDFLKSQIDIHLEQYSEITELETEIEAQKYFAIQKRKHFVGREDVLYTISNYINGEESRPLVIHGSSGLGKSALMSKAIEQAESDRGKKVCYRFIGATPNSGTSKEILLSVFEELGIEFHLEKKTNTFTFDNIQQENFEEFSFRAHDSFTRITDQVVIFIDAVDQLGNDDQFLWLPKNLSRNIKIILSALNDPKYPEDSNYFQTLTRKTKNLIDVPLYNNPLPLLSTLLQEEGRCLKSEQEKYFLKQYDKVKSPLFIIIAVQLLKRWRSFDGILDHLPNHGGSMHKIASSQLGMIEEFIMNLYNYGHHDKLLVEKVLGYINASREGLSEGELLELFSTDENFINKVAAETFHINHTKELPMVIWARLYCQLMPFLKRSTQNGQELLSFFHREFKDNISFYINQKKEAQSLMLANQKLITKVQNKSFKSNRWGSLYLEILIFFKTKYGIDSLKNSTPFITSLDTNWISQFLGYCKASGNLHTSLSKEYLAIDYFELQDMYLTELRHLKPSLWLKDYLSNSISLARLYLKINKGDLSISIGKKTLQISQNCFDKLPSKWVVIHVSALVGLANALKNIEKYHESIPLEEKALDIIKIEYTKNPNKWEEDHHTILNNLAYSYIQTNQEWASIPLNKGALKISKDLYQQNPEKWASKYSLSLSNLGDSYKYTNQIEKCIPLKELSLKIRGNLYDKNPDKWAEKYSRILNNLADSYVQNNQAEKSVQLSRKAIEITKARYIKHKERWAEEYTFSIMALALSYSKLGNSIQSLELNLEANKILESLFKERPNRWAYDYTTNLHNLACNYSKLEQTKMAITFSEKAATLLCNLSEKNPDRWVKVFIICLGNLLDYLEATRQEEKGVVFHEKLIKILDALYRDNADKWCEEYLLELHQLIGTYTRLNKLRKIVRLRKKVLVIQKRLYSEYHKDLDIDESEQSVERLALAYAHLGISYLKIGKPEKSLKFLNKARYFRRDLYLKNPIKWAKRYAVSISNLAIAYFRLNEFKKASKFFTKQRQIYGKHFPNEHEKLLSIDKYINLTDEKLK